MRARLLFRELGDRGEPWPAWVRALAQRSGVYVVRDLDSKEVLYVGESHKGRLYGTLTRHFQVWSRAKRFWAGMLGTPHDPGLTYARDRVAVAVLVTDAARAIETQNALICDLKPRDNVTGVDACAVDGDDLLPF